jgi:glycosyltransferase involved in cell wall biosynthesis
MRIVMLDPLLATIPYDKALVGALVEAGHDVLVCGRQLREGELWEKSRGAYLELPLTLPNPPPTASGMRLRVYWWSYQIKYLRALFFALRNSRKFRPDIIHTQWMLVPLLDSIVLKMTSNRIGKILTMHDTEVANGGEVQRVQVFGLERVLRHFDRIIVHTDVAIDRLVKRGVEPSKITRIPHGVLTVASTKSTGEPPRKDKVTFMLFGILKHYKGVDVLIRAVQAMSPSARDCCRFIVAGKAAMNVEELISMSKRCGVFHLFDFRIGFIPDDEFDNVLKLADVFVYPYREIEASGALMLSLQYGKPIIASNIGLFSEMLASGVHGRLVEPEDAQGLSEALECLTIDKDFRARAGHNVKQLADGIPTWTEIAEKTAREYQKVARRYLSPPSRQPPRPMRNS